MSRENAVGGGSVVGGQRSFGERLAALRGLCACGAGGLQP